VSDSWKSGGMQTLVTLKPEASLAIANEKLKDLVIKNCDDCTNHPSCFSFHNCIFTINLRRGKQPVEESIR